MLLMQDPERAVLSHIAWVRQNGYPDVARENLPICVTYVEGGVDAAQRLVREGVLLPDPNEGVAVNMPYLGEVCRPFMCFRAGPGFDAALRKYKITPQSAYPGQ